MGDVNTGATREMIDRLPVMPYRPDLSKSNEDTACVTSSSHPLSLSLSLSLSLTLSLSLSLSPLPPTNSCLICQMDFEEGQEIRGLPCMHFYHKDCVDIWLSKKKTCPKCIQRIDAIQA